jgi:hypothetical protein
MAYLIGIGAPVLLIVIFFALCNLGEALSSNLHNRRNKCL